MLEVSKARLKESYLEKVTFTFQGKNFNNFFLILVGFMLEWTIFLNL